MSFLPSNSIHEAPLFGLNPVMNAMYTGKNFAEHSATSADPITKTQSPIVTGTSVLGIKFKDGVMVVSDTLGSYGSLARFRDERRVFQAGDFTAIACSGDLSDYNYVQNQIQRLLIEDYCVSDGHKYSPENIYEYLSRMMYNHRNKFDPLWNTYMVAGFRNGRKFLGCVDLQGTTWQASTLATGYGMYIAQPLLRKAVEGKEDVLTEQEATELLENTMRVMFYRDARSLNRIQRAIITKEGVRITEPYSLSTDWTIAEYVKGYGA